MDRVELIRIFTRVVEAKSFSNVARELEVSQPTISKAIRALEQELGLALLRRSTRGLSLTNEGQKLYNSGRPLLEHFEQVIASVQNQKQNLIGELRITASLAFARIILAPTFPQIAKLHPELRFSFLVSDGYVDLIENNIDLAIRIGELADSQLRAVKIGLARRALYASRAYVKEFGSPRNLAELQSHRLLFYTRLSDRPMWPLEAKSGQKQPYYFVPFFKSDGSDLMRQAVIEGLGIALLPTWMALDLEKGNELVRVLPEFSGSPSPIYAVTAATKELSAKQRTLLEFFREAFAKNPDLSPRR